jgi:hypothetical protein
MRRMTDPHKRKLRKAARKAHRHHLHAVLDHNGHHHREHKHR